MCRLFICFEGAVPAEVACVSGTIPVMPKIPFWLDFLDIFVQLALDCVQAKFPGLVGDVFLGVCFLSFFRLTRFET